MFTISSKGDYGLVLMATLAKNSPQAPFSLRQIAEGQNLPFRYLSQIAIRLKKAGLLRSKEGVDGGYFLAKDPAKITIGEIFGAIDGPTAPTRCLSLTGGCQAESVCLMKPIWGGLQKELAQTIEKKTLKDLLD